MVSVREDRDNTGQHQPRVNQNAYTIYKKKTKTEEHGYKILYKI